MNKRKNSLVTYLIITIITFGLVWIGTKNRASASPQELNALPISEPVVMVPGTNGNVDQFDGLIKTLEKKESGIDVVKLTVETDGSVQAAGKFSTGTQHPILVVAFDDGSDESLSKQSEWLQKAFAYTEQFYAFSTYDYLGYSNGGLILTGYLENEQQKSDPTLNHLVTLGTPYNGTDWEDNDNSTVFTEPRKKSPLLMDYLKGRDNIPKNISVYNISGNVDNQNTDGTVPLTSVLAGRLIYGDSKSYQEITIDENADHGSLIENTKTVQLIQKYLFDQIK
ncbi:alpha/beta hydrolase [Enterococcus sp. AZ163]|uniref:alpha/beta hydrolase n=1 Tax=Enterococcus sp. AZ163 TaxID=2774638 RepID=UPI003D2E00EB